MNAATNIFNMKMDALMPERPFLSAIFFGLWLSLVTLSVSLIFAAIAEYFPGLSIDSSYTSGLEKLNYIDLFVICVLVGPLLETLVLQLFLIEVVRKFTASKYSAIVLSAAAFGLGHYYHGGLSKSIPTFMTGLIFAYGYSQVRTKGIFTSYTVTGVAHVMHNFIALFVLAPIFDH
ncbi:CPBP family intramembrane glutamic endopeptidase [Solimicrobium silvestre]|uniref:CAAX protease self-immunity n=1 Tax=Solimicrobium silvestre TaxID=2099400 RepID=A0A2S9H3R7_9BURK|nr:CPBP family intramembrane glutamic endopeptidase [Solimicrobium silvestre]PRC94573.1 CAAX protease self-immunity [Solimicrobium silvestre]